MTTQLSDLSTTIAEVMGSVLKRGPLASDEDFFEAGGDSLRAVEVLQRFVAETELPASVNSDELQAELLVSIFDEATPAALAAVATAHFTK
ncbi:phosphopantetheine-binding protein [Amycolatopsis sp. H20-H5]|uniref:phosphopantetheine-binding protein n=1 Tax=Amycolatopsis sp. H20-H5 TaxID=3046309 RepID=UPI002DBC8EA9|nr:phosphopantetheine-binding protein [Amycolatopsis sp. H20-H5]MEC3976884.1 phosphopantetheine-binding protein [Amycolatopsis sp. H20-H5]